LKIAINALYLLPGRVGGSETYIRNLVAWLARIDRSNAYIVFVNRESAGIFEELAPGCEVVTCPIRASNRPVRILWEQLALPFQLLRRRVDLLFSPGMTSPLLCPAPSVLVVFDLLHRLQPENFPPLYLMFLKTIIYLSAKVSAGVVAISEKVKRDLVDLYGLPPGRVAVTHLAVDRSSFFPRAAAEVEAVRARYGLPGRFILYAAASLPHKNHARLLGALKILKERGEDLRLVLIGARDKGAEALARNIEQAGLADDVVFTGWLPFEDIPPLYCAAEAFVYPTLNEGFGLPVIEAMACGVPVVCSDIEPLPEVAGDAARFVNASDQAAIADGISAVLGDRELRARLVEKGFRRAAEFTWERTARTTLAFMLSVGKAAGGADGGAPPAERPVSERKQP
jgi:glycosyltransferase involved in cell wall biosynthesis